MFRVCWNATKLIHFWIVTALQYYCFLYRHAKPKAVSAYFTSEQILPSRFADQYTTDFPRNLFISMTVTVLPMTRRQARVTAVMDSAHSPGGSVTTVIGSAHVPPPATIFPNAVLILGQRCRVHECRHYDSLRRRKNGSFIWVHKRQHALSSWLTLTTLKYFCMNHGDQGVLFQFEIITKCLS